MLPRRLVALLVVAAVLGAASSGGAQVDPSGQGGPAVWSATCVPSGPSELVVYGRGFGAGSVALEVTDQTGAVVGRAAPAAADRAGGAAFQARVPLAVPATALALHVSATQPGRTAGHDLVAAPTCSPAVTAAVGGVTCAAPGRPVPILTTVRGVPPAIYFAVAQHVDLYGPAETVDRSQPARPDGSYNLSLGVPNVPDRLVPVTVEARRADGSFAYATANVTLPPACAPAPTTTTGPPGTTQPTLPGSSSPSMAPPTSGATTLPGRPAVTTPRAPAGAGPASVAVSPAVGRGGEATTVSGRGFTPSRPVTLRWRPGLGQWTVTVGGDGTFRTQVLVLPKDVEGPRVLEVDGGGAAPAPYLVVPGSEQPAFGGVFVRG